MTKDGGLFNIADDENDYRDYAWACELAQKYYRLSDYPWMPFELDPPRPVPLTNPRPAIDS